MLDRSQWIAIGLVSGFAYILGKDRESFDAESFEAEDEGKKILTKYIDSLLEKEIKYLKKEYPDENPEKDGDIKHYRKLIKLINAGEYRKASNLARSADTVVRDRYLDYTLINMLGDLDKLEKGQLNAESFDAEYRFQNQATTSVEADNEEEAWERFSGIDPEEIWVVNKMDAESFEAEEWDFGDDREALRKGDEHSDFNNAWRWIFKTKRRGWPKWGQKFYDKYKWTLDDPHWNPQLDAESFGAEYTLTEMANKSFRDIDKISGFVADRLNHTQESWANLTPLERKEVLYKIRQDEDLDYLYDGGFEDGETTILTKKQLKKYLDENYSSEDIIEINEGYIAKYKNVWDVEYLIVEELDYDEMEAESFEAEDTNDETVYIISGMEGNIIGTKKQLIQFTNKVMITSGLDGDLTKRGVKLLLDGGMNILDLIRLKKSGFIREVKKISPDYTKSDTFKEENPWFSADMWPTIKILNDLKKPITIFDEISYRAESFEADKKNCGCGQDPCVTYGAEPCEGESFGAESQEKTRYKITMDSWPMRIHVDGCPIAKNIPKEHHWEGTFTPQEVAQTAYDTLFYNESLPQFEGNTFGELRKTYAKDLIIPCNCTIHEMKSIKELDPATFIRQPNETQEHWDAESFGAEERFDCGCDYYEMMEGVMCESCGHTTCIDCSENINTTDENYKNWKCYEGYGCNKGAESSQ
tara:strand:- start:7087 stop:9186 length:2100 start_codon:yes stop_codon:yes gene_type:complete